MSVISYLEELHREMDSVRVPVGDLEVPRPCSTGANDDSVVLGPKLFCVDVDAHVRIGHESLHDTLLVVNNVQNRRVSYHSLCCHQIETTLDDRLVELHAATIIYQR